MLQKYNNNQIKILRESMKSAINYHQYLKEKGMKPAFLNRHDQQNKVRRTFSKRNPQKEQKYLCSQKRNYDSLMNPCLQSKQNTVDLSLNHINSPVKQLYLDNMKYSTPSTSPSVLTPTEKPTLKLQHKLKMQKYGSLFEIGEEKPLSYSIYLLKPPQEEMKDHQTLKITIGNNRETFKSREISQLGLSSQIGYQQQTNSDERRKEQEVDKSELVRQVMKKVKNLEEELSQITSLLENKLPRQISFYKQAYEEQKRKRLRIESECRELKTKIKKYQQILTQNEMFRQ